MSDDSRFDGLRVYEYIRGNTALYVIRDCRLYWIGFESNAVYEIRGNYLYELTADAPTYDIRGNKICNPTGGAIYEIR